MKLKFDIPAEVSRITEALEKAGFEAYLVGGCVRAILHDKKPKDWDITTSATPDEIKSLFSKTIYENTFGTVAVVNEGVTDESLKVIEITTYRLEGKYSDKRRPDEVKFSKNLEDDLKRRDFTMNAIALNISKNPPGNLDGLKKDGLAVELENNKGHIVDFFEGIKDMKSKIVRAIGDPNERFREDALRMLRAARFATLLDFEIEKNTISAVRANAKLLEHISGERIRDEFVKIIMSPNPMKGVLICHHLGLIRYIIPELEEGIECEQNGDHMYDVWEHLLRALQHSADRNWSLEVRLAALLHDIAKPRTRAWSKEKKDYTFYGHEVVGAKMAVKILERLKFSKDTVEKVYKLVRNHMFFTDIEKITLSAVRRIVRNVGPENVWYLMNVRACDRIGMGKPKESPYRLRKYESMIEEAMRAPTSVGMLKIDGNRIMEILNEPGSPKVGWILHALLEEVLDNPDLNTEEYLSKRAEELSSLSQKELEKLGKAGKEKKEEKEEKELSEIRKKYRVK
jgi:poly(A) polymerase/tRNA nucleotidyltransferase (CCA-adding enzyme)